VDTADLYCQLPDSGSEKYTRRSLLIQVFERFTDWFQFPTKSANWGLHLPAWNPTRSICGKFQLVVPRPSRWRAVAG